MNLRRGGVFILAVTLQEIWKIIDPATYKLKDFTFYYNDRKQYRGGGVGIYIFNDFSAKINTEFSIFIEKSIECLSLDFVFKNKKFNLTNLYRAPHNSTADLDSFFLHFESLLEKTNKSDTTYIICTDSNINLLKLTHCNLSQKYLELIHNYGFLQLVKKATRVQNETFSLIDHILLKNERSEPLTGVVPIDISDHFPTFLSLKEHCKSAKHKIITTRNLSQHNITNFKTALMELNWQNVLIQNDANSAFNEFWEVFQSLFDLYFPLTAKKFNRNIHRVNKFFTNGLLISRANKNKL